MISDTLREFKRLRDKKEDLAAQQKALQIDIDQLRKETIPQLFKEQGVGTISVDGYRYSLSSTVRASIKDGQKELAFGWLRENELGDLITETVNASTLSAQAREMLESGESELPDEIFHVYLDPNVSVTKV